MSIIKLIFRFISIPLQFIYGLLYFLLYWLVIGPTQKMARFILKEELKRAKNNKESSKLLLQEKKEEIEELKKIEKKYSYLISHRRNIADSEELIYFEVTPKGEPVLISCKHYNDIIGEHVSLYLYKFEDHIYNANTKIYGQIRSLFNEDSKIKIGKHTIVDLRKKECKYLYIQEFVSSVKEEGYGSTLLDFLLKICVGLKIDCIIGELAYIDKKNFFYTVPFYEQKGFKVYLSESKEEGAIIKYL